MAEATCVKLVKDVNFYSRGREIFIPQGTEIEVDLAENIGYYEDYFDNILEDHHFQIFPDEYILLH